MKTFVLFDKWGAVLGECSEWRDVLEDHCEYEPDAPSEYSSYAVDEDLSHCLEIDFELKLVAWHSREDIRNAFEGMRNG